MINVPPATILDAYIRSQSLMTLPLDGLDWPLYISYMPDGNTIKSNCGAIYNVSGKKDGRLHNGGLVIEHYGVKIVIRSTVHDTGWIKMNSIALALDAVRNAELTVDVIDYKIQNITRVEPIVPLGNDTDAKGRQFFADNFLVTIKTI